MNKPSVSLDTLMRLEAIEQDKATERALRVRGFTNADLSYRDVDGQRKLYISRVALNYIMANKEAMKKEIEKALREGTPKPLKPEWQ
jgi:hypothetical protein